MSYCLSPHDRDVLEDSARQVRIDNGFTPAERAVRDREPYDQERDEGDAA